MSKVIGDERVSEQALEQMRRLGGDWYAYQNMEIGHYDAGMLRFLKCGEDCTLKEPPKRHPDMPSEILWRYWLVGKLNLETGDIE